MGLDKAWQLEGGLAEGLLKDKKEGSHAVLVGAVVVVVEVVIVWE